VITITFQSVFSSKIHENNVFLFFKIYFFDIINQNNKKYTKKFKKKSRKSVSSAKKHTTPKLRCVKSLIKSFHGGKKLPWISQHEMIKVSSGLVHAKKRCQPVWFSCPLTTQSMKWSVSSARGLFPLWIQVRALWLLIWWPLETYMVVNFRVRKISWGAHKAGPDTHVKLKK